MSDSIDLDKVRDVNANILSFPDSANFDAAGRLRTSEQLTLIDVKHLFDKQPILVNEELIGTATATHNSGESSVTITAPANGDAAIMQTYQRSHYQSGQSHQFANTFYDFGNGSNMSVNISRNGSTVSVSRSDWDDPLDGTGDSKISHDFNNNTVFGCDFLWLGVARVRFYVKINGVDVQFHQEDFTDTTKVYMKSPNQPLRWECRQTGVGVYKNRVGYFTSNTTTPFNSNLDGIWIESDDAVGELTYICAAVNSEGATNLIGKVLSSNAGTNDIQLNSSGTTYSAIGIRLKSTHLDSVIDILNFDYMAETNDRALWELRLNPTVGAGTFNYTDVTDSAVQVSVGNQTAGTPPTATGGTLLASGYVQQQGSINVELDSAIRIGAAIDGTPNEIILCITPINAGLDAYVSYTWRELV